MSVLAAEGLGLRTRRGWVFRDVDISVEPGEIVALTGPAGSGRTSLLLALAGHFATTHGSLTRHGRAALGYVPGAMEPEPGLTAAEHVAERLLLLGLAPRGRAARRAAVAGVLAGFPGATGMLGRDLSGYQRHRLMLALATVGAAGGRPGLIAVDDVDVALDTRERQELWDALAKLAADGYALVVSCRELEPGRPAREVRM